MSNSRILDHTTIVPSTDLVADGYGFMAPRTMTVEGIIFTFMGDGSYANVDREESLYLEGSDDGTTFWYAETYPLEG